MLTKAWTWYDLGKSHLLSGKSYESLSDYAKGIQLSSNEELIKTAQNSLSKMIQTRNALAEYQWVQKLLQIGLAAKFPFTDDGKAALDQIVELSPSVQKPIKGPVTIVAGGCSAEFESQMPIYQRVILEAFCDFKGTIISGGTTSGISGLVGELQKKYPSKIHTIGYVPNSKTDLVDKRYREIRYTEGENFSPIEPLQYWIDIAASGVSLQRVKLLGISGGGISAIEYRIALAFGSSVAIIQNSGMEADKLLSDADWNTSTSLFPLPNNPEAVQSFLKAQY
jgi:hypothetical protein